VSATGSNGLQIRGTRGQEVRAAAAGQVVYSGSGLRGYGQLLILKHDEVFLSAYAHNDTLLVADVPYENHGCEELTYEFLEAQKAKATQ
jgi:lipoprotein NlpD